MLNLILLGLEAIAFSVEEMPNKTEVLRIRNDCTLNTLNGIWVFPKIGVPRNGWFIMENLIKIDNFGVPLLLETSRSLATRCSFHQYVWGCLESFLVQIRQIYVFFGGT